MQWPRLFSIFKTMKLTLPDHPLKNLPISLDYRFQGELYMLVELLLTTEINVFLMEELESERLRVEKLRNFMIWWQQESHYEVKELHFDLATQAVIAEDNIDELQFSKTGGANKAVLLSVIGDWKTTAKEMSIRTFCNPDVAVKKHLYAAERIMDLIGASTDSKTSIKKLTSLALHLIDCAEVEHEAL